VPEVVPSPPGRERQEGEEDGGGQAYRRGPRFPAPAGRPRGGGRTRPGGDARGRLRTEAQHIPFRTATRIPVAPGSAVAVTGTAPVPVVPAPMRMRGPGAGTASSCHKRSQKVATDHRRHEAEETAMTMPEESRPKTEKTDQVVFDEQGQESARRAEEANKDRGNVGRELEDAMSEAGVDREDLTGEQDQGGR
jgi:hypothetical protein